MGAVNKLAGYPMKELVPLIKQFLGEGKSVILTAKGNSMRPMVSDGRDAVILSSLGDKPIDVGDVILYERTEDVYVLHRVVEISEDGSFVFMGDGQAHTERGIVSSQMIAKLSGIIRKEKTISCESKKYLRYSRFWTKSRFIRRVYIKLSGIFCKNK